MITQALLRETLDYNPETGIFTWIKPTGNRVRVGDTCTCQNMTGHVVITIKGKRYTAHRLAFLWMTGEKAPFILSHENGNFSDNRWENLKPLEGGHDMRQMKTHKDNKSGVKGVAYCEKRDQYIAHIYYNKKTHHLGRFDTLEEAAAVVRAKRIEVHGEHAFHG